MVILLRVTLGILVAVAAGVVAVPLLLVFDLVSGGNGFGVCSRGLIGCEPGYFTGVELAGILLLVLFVAIAGIALCARGIRYLDRRQSEAVGLES